MKTVVVALLAALAVPPVQAVEGDVSWTVRTTSTQSSFGYDVRPGSTTTDAMVVANRGTEAVTLAIYAADGYTTDAGQLDLLAGDEPSQAIGTWVRPEQSTVTVAPGKAVEVPFRITVPENATPGDHVGGIVTSLTTAGQSTNVNVERRLGIKIKLRVAGDLAPALAIENLDAGHHDGTATISYTIHNTGNAVQTARQAVTISGPFGWFRTEATAIAAPPELLPGESWQVTVPVENVAPAVLLTATTTVTPMLTDASGSTTALTPVTATTSTWAIPWVYAVLVVVLIALVILLVVLIRRQRTRRKQREDQRVKEAVEQALSAKA